MTEQQLAQSLVDQINKDFTAVDIHGERLIKASLKVAPLQDAIFMGQSKPAPGYRLWKYLPAKYESWDELEKEIEERFGKENIAPYSLTPITPITVKTLWNEELT